MKLTPEKAEREIVKIVKGKKGISTANIDKMEKFAHDKFTGKKNPPRLITYGQFVDLVQERKSRLRSEISRRR